MSANTEFHSTFGDGVRWKICPDGVEVEGEGVPRTPGNPYLVVRVWDSYSEAILKWAVEYGVPIELIVATICTESGGNANAVRHEPGYVSDSDTPHKVSVGLMQTLISTARFAIRKYAPEADVSHVDSKWLKIPTNSIQAGAGYIRFQSPSTKFDPVLVAAAYNAGGIYRQDGPKNKFKLRQFPIGTSHHCERFIQFFNDFWYIVNVGDLPNIIPCLRRESGFFV